jgi:hypothetical protein
VVPDWLRGSAFMPGTQAQLAVGDDGLAGGDAGGEQ